MLLSLISQWGNLKKNKNTHFGFGTVVSFTLFQLVKSFWQQLWRIWCLSKRPPAKNDRLGAKRQKHQATTGKLVLN